MKEFEEAIDRVMAGERKTRHERAREAGDRLPRGAGALVAHILPNTDPVHRSA